MLIRRSLEHIIIGKPKRTGCMKKIHIICFSFLLLVGCNNNSNSSDLGSKNAHECVEPQNPYGDTDSGHYAGFEWAMQNGGSCDGNSESFNEGCEEYQTQLDEYDECLSHKK
jgi:hypothetical protein